ncbi:MAG TPA: SPFH domain-containing protein, partial [Nakamurella sp.]
MDILAIIGAVLAVMVVVLGLSIRVVKQYERALIFRFGRLVGQPRGPGLTLIVPVVDRLKKINMQIVTMPVPAQDGITKDNVTVNVDAVVYFRVIDPVLAGVNVQNYPFAVSQVAQTSLRSV